MILNEEQILSNKFVFVSYSHEDAGVLKEDMDALMLRGVRVWYDEHMRLGEKWTEVAERVIKHENCVGVLFYNSPKSFISKSVQKEQKMAKERLSNGNFRIWSVHIDSKSTEDIIREATMVTPNFAEYMLAMPLQAELFNSAYLCIMRFDSASTVERIYNEIAEPCNIVDNENNFMRSVKKSGRLTQTKNEITLGRYISSPYYGPEQPDSAENQRFGSLIPLIQLDGKRYNTKELTWQLMYVKDGRAIMLCTHILGQMTFGLGKAFLNKEFIGIAFTESDNVHGNIVARYMTDDDVIQAKAANNIAALKLDATNGIKHWWVNEDGMTEYWKKTYSDDCEHKKGFNTFFKKGIRPVIELPVKLFK